jgi:hypothetical protein
MKKHEISREIAILVDYIRVTLQLGTRSGSGFKSNRITTKNYHEYSAKFREIIATKFRGIKFYFVLIFVFREIKKSTFVSTLL